MEPQRRHQGIRLTDQMRLVLASMVATDRPVYGYDLAKKVGQHNIRSIVGTLHRLETAGYARIVDAPEGAPPQGPGRDRVWFELTDEGREFAEHTRQSAVFKAERTARALGLELGGLTL
jgi:DNA-binding PadR family transcriptional regulator